MVDPGGWAVRGFVFSGATGPPPRAIDKDARPVWVRLANAKDPVSGFVRPGQTQCLGSFRRVVVGFVPPAWS